MTAHTIVEAFADAASRLIGDPDVAGNLVALLHDCVNVLDAQAAGLLVDVADTGLELLSSTSHQIEELELYELQHGLGPCTEAIRTNTVVSASLERLAADWKPVGAAMIRAGYQSVHAFPLRWRRHPIGALNLFSTSSDPLDQEGRQLGQTFADLATATVAQPLGLSLSALQSLIIRDLDARIVLEQAKGILAAVNQLDMAEAYDLLIRTASGQGRPLEELARRIVDGRGHYIPPVAPQATPGERGQR